MPFDHIATDFFQKHTSRSSVPKGDLGVFNGLGDSFFNTNHAR